MDFFIGYLSKHVTSNSKATCKNCHQRCPGNNMNAKKGGKFTYPEDLAKHEKNPGQKNKSQKKI